MISWSLSTSAVRGRLARSPVMVTHQGMEAGEEAAQVKQAAESATAELRQSL
jgi:hypothetical protein